MKRTLSGVSLLIAMPIALVASAIVLSSCTLFSHPSVDVVGDSITYLSRSPIQSYLSSGGYSPTIKAVPGAKIVQSLATVNTLAVHPPTDWIIELGTDDAGASNTGWSLPFLAVWKAVSPSDCVIFVTISTQAGPIAADINSTIGQLIKTNHNAHELDWGNIEYSHPGWVHSDNIHPTPAGQVQLAQDELHALQSDC